MLVVSETVVLVVAIVVAALTSTADDWDPPALVALLLGLALATDWFAVSHGGQRISGSFLALVLAAALLGPAPATAIGIAAVLFDQVRARNPLPRLIANLAAFATFPLVGGLIIDAADVAPESAAFPLLVFATFLVTNLLNFLMIGGHHAFETRTPLADGFRRIFVPVLPSEILSAVLCALVATFYARTGVAAIALMLFVLLTFQYLLRELLLSRERAERLAGAPARRADLDDRDARAARPDDRPPLRRGRPLRPRDGEGARLERRASRTSCTPRGCCTTSASSPSRTRSCWPTRG